MARQWGYGLFGFFGLPILLNVERNSLFNRNWHTTKKTRTTQQLVDWLTINSVRHNKRAILLTPLLVLKLDRIHQECKKQITIISLPWQNKVTIENYKISLFQSSNCLIKSLVKSWEKRTLLWYSHSMWLFEKKVEITIIDPGLSPVSSIGEQLRVAVLLKSNGFRWSLFDSIIHRLSHFFIGFNLINFWHLISSNPMNDWIRSILSIVYYYWLSIGFIQ